MMLMSKLEIPSGMEVAPRYTLLTLTLFTLFALFIQFKLLYTAETIACFSIYLVGED